MDPINAMVQMGNGVQTPPAANDPIQAMVNMGLKPDQAAALQGHSTAQMTKFMGGQQTTGAFSPQGMQSLGGQVQGALPTAGAIGGALLGGAGGAVVGGPVGAYAGGVAGAAAGGALGETAKEGLQGGGLQPGEIAKQGAINGGLEAVGGPLLSTAGKFMSRAVNPITEGLGKAASYIGSKLGGDVASNAIGDTATPAAIRATKLIQSSADTMTKKEQEQAATRLVPTISGGGKFEASDAEQRAGQLLAGKLSTNPVRNIPVIDQQISKLGKGAEDYLTTNAKPITNAEDYTMFQQKRIESEKYMTPAAVQAYDEQISVFQKVLKDFTGNDAGGYNTANYYKALKDFESNVTANLPKGKEALLDVGGSARLQAAKDVREVVRDMVGQKNPEFKNQMFDIASLYGARDTNISKALQVDSFAKRHPYLIGGAKIVGGGAAAGVGLEGINEIKKVTGL